MHHRSQWAPGSAGWVYTAVLTCSWTGPWNVSTESEGSSEGPEHSAVLADVVATMGGEEGVMSGAVDSGLGTATEAVTPDLATDGLHGDRRRTCWMQRRVFNPIRSKWLKCSCECKRIQEFCVP